MTNLSLAAGRLKTPLFRASCRTAGRSADRVDRRLADTRAFASCTDAESASGQQRRSRPLPARALAAREPCVSARSIECAARRRRRSLRLQCVRQPEQEDEGAGAQVGVFHRQPFGVAPGVEASDGLGGVGHAFVFLPLALVAGGGFCCRAPTRS